jgi:hypothetical protein
MAVVAVQVSVPAALVVRRRIIVAATGQAEGANHHTKSKVYQSSSVPSHARPFV